MSRMRLTFALTVVCIALAAAAAAQEPDLLSDPSLLANARRIQFHPAPHDLTNGQAHARFGISGIDSIPNFNGQFFADGFDAAGNPNRHWYTNTVGNPPEIGGTTSIGAPVQAVNIALLDAAGKLRYRNGRPMIVSAEPYIPAVLNSPVFAPAAYSDSDVPTQFADAIHRAQFYNRMRPDWHTLLRAREIPPVTVGIRQGAACPTGPFFAGCNYVFTLKPDGNCCSVVYLSNAAAFESFSQVLFQDVVSGAVTQHDITTTIWPDVGIFFDDLRDCCVIGFHTYAYDSTLTPERRYVADMASWVSASPDAPDVHVLSHEISEIYNDPFVTSDGVHNLTPWWLAPNGLCQNTRESGDVIEMLPNASYPMTMNGFTYHPQTEALLQWFEFKPQSDAFAGAYSYPDMTVLTNPPVMQKRGCAP